MEEGHVKHLTHQQFSRNAQRIVRRLLARAAGRCACIRAAATDMATKATPIRDEAAGEEVVLQKTLEMHHPRERFPALVVPGGLLVCSRAQNFARDWDMSEIVTQ